MEEEKCSKLNYTRDRSPNNSTYIEFGDTERVPVRVLRPNACDDLRRDAGVRRGSLSTVKRADIPSRTIVLETIASDIRKKPVWFHEWNGFAYNDREIEYRADFGTHYGPMCAKRRIGNLIAKMIKLLTDEHRRKSTIFSIGSHWTTLLGRL